MMKAAIITFYSPIHWHLDQKYCGTYQNDYVYILLLMFYGKQTQPLSFPLP